MALRERRGQASLPAWPNYSRGPIGCRLQWYRGARIESALLSRAFALIRLTFVSLPLCWAAAALYATG
ncbi:hypothetical protein BST61_g5152 [Cercospora zeina]